MKRLCCLLCLSVVPFLHATAESPAAFAQAQPLRIIAFGAHPDDAELKASGVAALWAAAGHKVKFVAMTNGDVGHFGTAGGPLARRRAAEVAECARILGIETEVMDIHDGELTPSLENRKTMARLIRSWQADIVMGHRPYDYHPDHRYTGVLMDDSAVVVVAPFFVPDTPPTRRNPVFLYYSDGFQDPKPFTPSIVVGIDDVAEKKWACVSAMPSQFGDEDSWQGRTLRERTKGRPRARGLSARYREEAEPGHRRPIPGPARLVIWGRARKESPVRRGLPARAVWAAAVARRPEADVPDASVTPWVVTAPCPRAPNSTRPVCAIMMRMGPLRCPLPRRPRSPWSA